MNDKKAADVLVVEDDPCDVELVQRGFGNGRLQHRLHVVGDGRSALAYLRRQGEYRDAPRPDLIVLDLSLPGVGGDVVLEHVRRDPDLELVPVVVLSTSREPSDVRKSYALRANCYVTKPFTADAFIDAVRSIEEFWTSVVRLPDA